VRLKPRRFFSGQRHYRRYAVRHGFSIYTLRVRIRAGGFRYFRFYPLRCRKTASCRFSALGLLRKPKDLPKPASLPARLHRQMAPAAHTAA
jgi:hypothetical protein